MQNLSAAGVNLGKRPSIYAGPRRDLDSINRVASDKVRGTQGAILAKRPGDLLKSLYLLPLLLAPGPPYHQIPGPAQGFCCLGLSLSRFIQDLARYGLCRPLPDPYVNL